MRTSGLPPRADRDQESLEPRHAHAVFHRLGPEPSRGPSQPQIVRVQRRLPSLIDGRRRGPAKLERRRSDGLDLRIETRETTIVPTYTVPSSSMNMPFELHPSQMVETSAHRVPACHISTRALRRTPGSHGSWCARCAGASSESGRRAERSPHDRHRGRALPQCRPVSPQIAPDYSCRSARIGSIRDARCAGIHPAPATTSSSTVTAAASTAGS
jgi:hypothetical protein